MFVTGGTFLASTSFIMHAVVKPTPSQESTQFLCHWLVGVLVAWRGLGQPWMRLIPWLFFLGSAYGQTEAPSALQNKLLNEVSQWAQKTHQLEADQFSFAPLDARVQVQTCDRPLVMDLPFATRETVRVRCLGSPYWQLYMRLVLKPGVTLAGTPVSAPQAVATPSNVAATPAKAAASAPVMRKVIVAKQLLRSGTSVMPDMLEEQEVPAQGVDLQAVTSVKDLENGEMVRDMQAGVPLRSHDVRRAILVKQGQIVILTVGQSSGFAISARVEALQDGRMGEQIRLKNPESGRILSGVVTGPNAARGL
jgi:flagella basal body P-ring formation protein FlgA